MSDESQIDAMTFLGRRRARILELLGEAARRSGRRADDVTLVAVSKTVGPEQVAAAWRVGYRRFGENRPQELSRKLAALAAHPELSPLRFDMIGNLQTNKINQVLGRAALIHSVSSLHLATSIAKRAALRGIVSEVLLEVNVSGEASKGGFSAQELRRDIDRLAGLEGIAVRGLMTMAPAHEAAGARRTFAGLRELADELRQASGLPLEQLSAGMSDDFEAAVEEGSTIVRLGRVVFDPGYTIA